VARGHVRVEYVVAEHQAAVAVDAALKEGTVDEAEAARLRQENKELRARIDDLERELKALAARPGPPQAGSGVPLRGSAATAELATRIKRETTAWAEDDEAVYQRIKTRLLEELPSEPRVLAVVTARPELRVEVERHVIKVDGTSLCGRIARLIADDFFAGARTSAQVLEELLKRGADRPSNIELGNELKALCDMGFFTRDNKWYSLVPGMAVNVIER
jgi:hypothetical protein